MALATKLDVASEALVEVISLQPIAIVDHVCTIDEGVLKSLIPDEVGGSHRGAHGGCRRRGGLRASAAASGQAGPGSGIPKIAPYPGRSQAGRQGNPRPPGILCPWARYLPPASPQSTLPSRGFFYLAQPRLTALLTRHERQ